MPMFSLSEPHRETCRNQVQRWPLNIGQLAHALQGKLILSATPPRGGDMEPIGRVLLESQSYRNGDLVVMTESATEGCFLEAPMMQGATGIIAERPITPMAGCYQILVDDVSQVIRVLETLAAIMNRSAPENEIDAATASCRSTRDSTRPDNDLQRTIEWRHRL